MKITTISLVLFLFTVGCSKKENAPLRFAITHGDITPMEITTNVYRGDTYYIIQIKLSSAKESELSRLAQQYPNRQVEVVVGSKISKMRMPAKALKPPIQWAVSFCSLADARAAEAELKKLSQ